MIPLSSVVRRWLLPVGAVLAAASCSETVGPGSYQVTYRAGNGGTPQDSVFVIDSVFYTNNLGRLVKVSAPAVPWVNVVSPFYPGTHIEGHLYATARAARTAKFVVLWMTATGAISADSQMVQTTAATAFQIHIPTNCTTLPAPDTLGNRNVTCGPVAP